MSIYNVSVCFVGYHDFEVEAENEEEARQIAFEDADSYQALINAEVDSIDVWCNSED